uniref:C-SKI_SMAD_bind domain-containing protein n=1 Tax=Caenorhabditis japonica TaxID=281687 RepID=A0A8R1DS46_CAEJA
MSLEERALPPPPTSQPQPQPQPHVQDHRTPDLMDNDPLLGNLEALHYETRSDNEPSSSSSPSTSALPSSSSEEVAEEKPKTVKYTAVKQKRHMDAGRFMWIWMLGIRVPALVINGEPNMPIEVLQAALAKYNIDDGKFFEDLLRTKNIYVKMATPRQFRAVHDKCETLQQLKITSMSLLSRSDVERIMGELRTESRPTMAEHEKWNDENRVHVVHVNFIDYCDSWLESDDLDEDPYEAGTHGWWYKDRINMRCIICQQCEQKFTPTDFIMHHHYPVKTDGIVHCGLSTANWFHYIKLYKDGATPENQAAWQKFVMNAHRIGKRNYAEAAPRDDDEPEPEFTMEVDKNAELVEEGDEIEPKRRNWLDYDEEYDNPKRKLHIADFLGPSGSKGIIPKNHLEWEILTELNKLPQEDLENLFLLPPTEFYAWVREKDFFHKVTQRHKEWVVKTSHPSYRSTASASFDPIKGEFVDVQQFSTASKATKQEIVDLARQFSKIDRVANNPWEVMKQEHALFKTVSDDAMRVLNNRPLPPPPPPVLPKAVEPPTKPVGLNGFAQLAQQLLNSGVKLPMLPLPMPLPLPLPQLPVAPTPIKPVPILPMKHASLPLAPTIDLLKQHITLAMTTPSLFPVLYPKLPPTAFEQFTRLLQTTTVKN